MVIRRGFYLILVWIPFIFGSVKAETNLCSQVFYDQLVPHEVESISEFNQILETLKTVPELKKSYSSFNEISKKLTLEDHTRSVFIQFLIESHYKHLSKDFLRILPLTIALHDIGKPFAIAKGERDEQHLFTLPLVRSFLKEKGWEESDIQRSLALIRFTGFGELLKGEKSALDVAKEIIKISSELKVEAWDFYLAKRAFYLSDAGSYTQLRSFVLREDASGRLHPKGSQFEELEYWISHLI
ncbi:MAG: hypothetical protein ACXVB4_16660 [Pseudobdellovibrionaceae bacterium]